MNNPDEVLERISPNTARRVMATGCLGCLGVLLLWIAATQPPVDIGWLVFLILMGAGSLWLAWIVWDVSSRTLELTRLELREVGGRVLFTIDNVESVDRGFFAFKPAGGFLIRLKEPQGAKAYAPGLWWRRGRRVAVGGVTAARESKSVADLISVLLVQNRGGTKT